MTTISTQWEDKFYPPSTRYQGSKRKLLPWLHSHFKNLSFTSALDVFGGSGSVSYMLKKMCKAVTYNDALHFNYRIGNALVANDQCRLEPCETQQIIDAASRNNTRGFVSRTFGGMYFTDSENAWIDGAALNIEKSFVGERNCSYKRDLAYYALFQTCLAKRPFNLFHRCNLYLREASVQRRFGNKVTWDRPIGEMFSLFANEINRKVFKGSFKCAATCFPALIAPDKSYDLIYVDAPYLIPGRISETANYRRVYHFLEGLSQYRQWERLIDAGTTTKRLEERDENPWLSEDTVSQCFDSLFEKYADSIIAISIKKFGVPSVETIVRKLVRHNKRITRHSIHYKYALNGQNGDAARNREFLIIAE